jgi:hypothetical protein
VVKRGERDHHSNTVSRIPPEKECPLTDCPSGCPTHPSARFEVEVVEKVKSQRRQEKKIPGTGTPYQYSTPTYEQYPICRPAYCTYNVYELRYL